HAFKSLTNMVHTHIVAIEIPLPPDATIIAPMTGEDIATQLQLTLAGIIEGAHLSLHDLMWLLDHAVFQMEPNTPLDVWRSTKASTDLEAAGFDYLLVTEAWWRWLSTEEQATLTQDYELVQEWIGVVPEFYRLYRVP